MEGSFCESSAGNAGSPLWRLRQHEQALGDHGRCSSGHSESLPLAAAEISGSCPGPGRSRGPQARCWGLPRSFGPPLLCSCSLQWMHCQRSQYFKFVARMDRAYSGAGTQVTKKQQQDESGAPAVVASGIIVKQVSAMPGAWAPAAQAGALVWGH